MKTLLCLTMGILLAVFTYAAELQTTVKYISATAVYIDAGRMQGVAVGDRVDVRRDGKLMALLEVQFVADNSSSCKLMESTGIIQEGDQAVVITAAVPTLTDTTGQLKPTEKLAKPSEKIRARMAKKANRVSGRAGIELLWQDESEGLAYRFTQPSLSLRLKVDNLFASSHRLSIRMRGRRTDRDPEFSDATRSQWTGRVYEVSLSYDNPQVPYGYSVGRVYANTLRGIGSFDGAVFDYQTGDKFSVGLFGGTQPDLQTTEVNGDQTKFGVFGSYESRNAGGTQIQSTLALAGQYVKGNVSREFLYEQFSVIPNPKLWLLESAELNINRDWQKDFGVSSIEFANVLMNLRYRPVNRLTTSLTYDNRANYRTYDTRTTPDSLFDDSRRQGLRIGASYDLLQKLRISASGGLQKIASQDINTKTGLFDVLARDVVVRGLSVSAAFSTFSNSFTTGSQPSCAANYQMTPELVLGTEIGRSSYEYRFDKQTVSNDWIRLRADATLGRHLYGSTYFENYSGDTPALNRLFLELGVRL